MYRYARQVAEFFDFVKKKKEVPPPEACAAAAGNDQIKQIAVPRHQGGLWLPEALRGYDLGRSMSFLKGY